MTETHSLISLLPYNIQHLVVIDRIIVNCAQYTSRYSVVNFDNSLGVMKSKIVNILCVHNHFPLLMHSSSCAHLLLLFGRSMAAKLSTSCILLQCSVIRQVPGSQTLHFCLHSSLVRCHTATGLSLAAEYHNM